MTTSSAELDSPADPAPDPAPARSTRRALARVQAVSGLIFAGFLSLHLINLMVSTFGPGLYDAVQTRIRPIYRSPGIELGVLMTALVVHVGVGVVRMRQRPKTRDPRRLPRRTRLHRATAIFLLVVIFGHIAATRLPSVLDGVELGFAGLSFTMERYGAIFYPYYVLLGLCGLYHGGYGVLVALRTLGVRLPAAVGRGPVARGALLGGAVLVVLGVLSLGGLFYDIEDPASSDFARYARERFGVEP